MSRPPELPDFKSPPIKEVAISIQFERPDDFNQMYVKDIWELFSDKVSNARIEPRLAPIFETFSGQLRDMRKSNIKFEAHPGPIENRCVFSSEHRNSIIQFQSDRVSLNWKEDDEGAYPRFENIFAEFQSVFDQIQQFFEKQNWGTIEPNQCELVYSNEIPFSQVSEAAQALKTQTLNDLDNVEGFHFQFSRQLKNEEGAYARSYVHAWTSIDDEGVPYLLLNITVRGRPLGGEIKDCWSFFSEARVCIVEMFTQITSDGAHKSWGRIA